MDGTKEAMQGPFKTVKSPSKVAKAGLIGAGESTAEKINLSVRHWFSICTWKQGLVGG